MSKTITVELDYNELERVYELFCDSDNYDGKDYGLLLKLKAALTENNKPGGE